MCNEFQKRYSRFLISDRFAQIKIPLRWADAEANTPLDTPVRPTDRATIIRPIDADHPTAGLEGLDMRWWMVPSFHRGAMKDWRTMCTNARVETVNSAPTFREAYRRRRCLVPLTSFIEYSEPPGWTKGKPKQRNEIEWEDGDVRYFAGLWERSTPSDMPEGVETFAFVTGPAGPDVTSIHDRCPAVLTIAQGMEWLGLDGPGKSALEQPAPPGTFTVKLSPRESLMSAEMRRAI
ncbi:SOS response-associated peptidase [Phenylobacterium immobile]|uniref:SOS response-associated peptidase n=1 Tax=Phenylobacterium immobile TaxID=21 RepID=UPI000A7B161D|nr:SOS response-associated peptidase family protein [Phenylobacterium immobile]